MKFLSVCSGIEAASVAWNPLGWEAVAFSEIDRFPCALLAQHYPSVPNWGDMTRFAEWPDAAIDVLVGGTPCQSFSVAGLRKGLADPRGNLALTYLACVDKYRPRWVVWENVPGVLSVHDGRAFGAFIGGLRELGYLGGWRSFDAQYFGLAQRRERVFVVGYLGDWRRAAAVLFEPESLSGHPAPRREAGQNAPTIPSRRTAGGGLGTDFDCDGGLIPSTETETLIAHSLRADGFDASEDVAGRGTPLIAFSVKDHGADAGEIAPTLRAGGYDKSHANGGVMPAVAFLHCNKGRPDGRQSEHTEMVTVEADTVPTLATDGHRQSAVAFNWQSGGDARGLQAQAQALSASQTPAMQRGMQVRRLTPRECARLQGFPDHYLDIIYRGKPAADGPKYKALGNSIAIPVLSWIGQRIQMVEDLVNG